jgi:hypothetical protein
VQGHKVVQPIMEKVRKGMLKTQSLRRKNRLEYKFRSYEARALCPP